jgi:hypothetical protein
VIQSSDDDSDCVGLAGNSAALVFWGVVKRSKEKENEILS